MRSARLLEYSEGFGVAGQHMDRLEQRTHLVRVRIGARVRARVYNRLEQRAHR